MMKRLITAVLVSLLATAGVVVTASPAAAAVCAPNEFCISKTYGADPYFRKTPPQAPAGTCVTMPIQDFTRYVENRTQYDWWVWLTGSCSGTRATMHSYTSGAMNATWSDRIRSVMRLSHNDG